MADVEITRNDTWPPLRGVAEDADGLLPLADADSIEVHMKDGGNLIEGPAEVIDPPDADGFNWRYTWEAGDTDTLGSYDVELEVTWDSVATPPSVQTVRTGDVVNVIEELA
jgi:hypothetical protein